MIEEALRAAAVLVAAASPMAAQGPVWGVDDDPGPGVDFSEWQGAIDAAV